MIRIMVDVFLDDTQTAARDDIITVLSKYSTVYITSNTGKFDEEKSSVTTHKCNHDLDQNLQCTDKVVIV